VSFESSKGGEEREHDKCSVNPGPDDCGTVRLQSIVETSRVSIYSTVGYRDPTAQEL